MVVYSFNIKILKYVSNVLIRELTTVVTTVSLRWAMNSGLKFSQSHWVSLWPQCFLSALMHVNRSIMWWYQTICSSLWSSILLGSYWDTNSRPRFWFAALESYSTAYCSSYQDLYYDVFLKNYYLHLSELSVVFPLKHDQTVCEASVKPFSFFPCSLFFIIAGTSFSH